MGSLPVHRAEASSQASRWKYALFGLFVLWGWRQRALDRPAAAPAIDAASKLDLDRPAAAPATDAASKLDLVFTLDVTGSMGAYIDSAKENIEAITERLVSRNGQRVDMRFGIVAYRDHPPQDETFVTKSFPFTRDVGQMRGALSELKASGGGDAPEAVGTALGATLDCDWRKDATKVVILIADAPPHGLSSTGSDSFPNGEPTGTDPFEKLKSLAQLGATIYSVVPGNDRAAIAFFGAAAKQTNGRAVAMKSAKYLADVVVGASLEEMDLEKLLPQIQEITEEIRAADASVSDEAVQSKVFERLSATKTRSRRTVIHSTLGDDDVVTGATSLKEASAMYAASAPPPSPPTLEMHGRKRSVHRMGAPAMAFAERSAAAFAVDAGVAADAAPEVELAHDEVVSEEAIRRAWNKGKALGKYD